MHAASAVRKVARPKGETPLLAAEPLEDSNFTEPAAGAALVPNPLADDDDDGASGRGEGLPSPGRELVRVSAGGQDGSRVTASHRDGDATESTRLIRA